jgi:Xaa-Pro aminopeptidase
MFSPEIYSERRAKLREGLGDGLVLFPANSNVPFNYPANIYTFRQDSSFLYFFGIDHPDLFGVMDLDDGNDFIFGNDLTIDDIIWMGDQPSVSEQARKAGVEKTAPLKDFSGFIRTAISKGRKIHYLPPYRCEIMMFLSGILDIPMSEIKAKASVELIKGVIGLRMKKEDAEIREIEKMVDVAGLMHTTGMKMARPGILEREISGTLEGIALANAGPVSFPVILTINGQTLHNHYHGNTLKEGRMLVIDAGCESDLHYASDITRSVPVGGKFSQKQKEIYEIVLTANLAGIAAVRPGLPFRDIHLLAAKEIVKGLMTLGIMKGNPDEAVAGGAHALFFPHGLGHPMGLDVHDLEGLGENWVGYDEEITRSREFGLAFLRFGRKLHDRFVMTVEPGIYFIPALIDIWKKENKFSQFIDYEKVETYRNFGGIRIEDDVLVTPTGGRVLGKPIPKTVAEIESLMKTK